MREILFRGKRIDNGEWVEGIPWFFSLPVEKAIIIYAMGLLGEEDGVSRYCGSCEVDPKSISQYTGLTDKNGKKIFKGDIVRYSRYATTHILYVADEFGAIYFYYSDRGRFCSIITVAMDDLNKRMEVIGNIHDNPELMEAEYE